MLQATLPEADTSQDLPEGYISPGAFHPNGTPSPVFDEQVSIVCHFFPT